jgi:hypothetical protein
MKSERYLYENYNNIILHEATMGNLLRSLSDEFYAVREQIKAGPLDSVQISVPLREVAYYHELLSDDVVVIDDDTGQLSGACILGLRCGKEFVIAGSEFENANFEEARRKESDPEYRADGNFIVTVYRLLLAPTIS